jgi:hypothetical protein
MYDYLAKIILLGPSGSGKSVLFLFSPSSRTVIVTSNPTY